MTIITVSNLDELYTALDNATGGETIQLESGNYGELGIWIGALPNSRGVYDSEVVITSANPDDMAIFEGIRVNASKNITFDHIHVEWTPGEGDTTKTDVVSVVKGAENIKFTNSKLEGRPVSEEFGGDPSGEGDVRTDFNGNVAGIGTGKGISVRGVDGFVFENNEVTGFHRGIVIGESQNIVVKDNYIHDLRSDGIDFAQVQNVLVEANEISNLTPYRFFNEATGKEDGDHADLIQFWTAGTEEATTDVIIRDNILHVSDTLGTQSIFMRNELVDSYGYGQELFYKNITITDNLIYNSHIHGITLGASEGLTISNNTLIQNMLHDGATGNTPSINVAQNSLDVTIENNITPAMATLPENMEELNWQVQNNLLIQSEDPNLDNYTGDLFIDALNGSYSSLVDLQAIPGSVIDGSNLGAEMTQFDYTPDTLTALVRSASDSNIGDDNTVHFDASLTADSTGFLGENGATYHWDFGDGNTATGMTISHTYAQAGDYGVVLTVTSDTGEVSQNLLIMEIPEIELVQLSVDENGVFDASTYETGVTITNPEEAIVQLDNGEYAFHLSDTSHLSIARGAQQLYSHDQMSISFGMKGDVDTNGGYLFMWPSSMRMTVSPEGTLKYELWNMDEQHFTLTANSDIAMNDWNHVTITYDSYQEKATIYINGAAAGEVTMTGLTDVRESWGLGLGYAFKDTFDGLIKDFEFRSDALSATDVAIRANDFLTSVGEPTDIVIPGNEAPVANADNAAVDEDGSVTLDVLSNDSDPENDSLSITNVSAPSHGTIINNGDGTLTYTPDADYNGTDSLTYTVTDGELTDTASVNLTVNAVNDAPVANGVNATLSEDAANGTTVGAINASDIDGDTLSYTIASGNEDGIFTVDENGLITVADNSNLDFETTTSHTLIVEVSDGQLSDTVAVNVAVEDVYETGPIDPEANVVYMPFDSGVVENLSDSGVNFTTSGTVTAENGALRLADGNSRVTFDRDDALMSNDAFSLSMDFKKDTGMEDSGGWLTYFSGTAAIALGRDGITLFGSDASGESFRFKTNGLGINDDDWHSLTYTYSAADELAALYVDGQMVASTQVSGAQVVTNSHTLNIGGFSKGSFSTGLIDNVSFDQIALTADQVAALHADEPVIVNEAPIAMDDSATLNEDGSITVDLLANDTDVDGDSLSIESLTNPAHGTLVDNGDGTVTYTPDADFNGTDTLTYTLTDGELTDTATLSLTVEAVNDAPVANDASGSVSEDAANGVDVATVIATDIDGDDLSFAITGGNDAGIFAIDDNGVVTIANNDNLDFETTSAHNLVVTVSDGELTDTAAVDVSVLDVYEVEPIAAADIAVGIDFNDDTITNLANNGVGTTTAGTATVENGALRLEDGNSRVSIDRDEAIYNNDEFSLSMDFKKDTGMEDSGGWLTYFSGTAIIALGKDGITLFGSDGDGDSFSFKTNGLGINDDDWHSLTYTYSANDELAALYVDGLMVASTEVSGSQNVTSSHTMHLGGAFKGSFSDGLIDNVSFVQTALSEEQVEALHMMPGELSATDYIM